MMKFSAAIEVLIEAGAPTAGATAHARTSAPRPKKLPDGRELPYDGTPTTAWPACIRMPKQLKPGRWRSTQGTLAVSHGAVLCTEKACYGKGGGSDG